MRLKYKGQIYVLERFRKQYETSHDFKIEKTPKVQTIKVKIDKFYYIKITVL